MKELSKDEIKQIAYNCRKATFLIEKKQLGRITVREKLELKIHLAGCSVCRLFEKQSIAINKLIKNHFPDGHRGEISSLDKSFKNTLQQLIEQKLKNK